MYRDQGISVADYKSAASSAAPPPPPPPPPAAPPAPPAPGAAAAPKPAAGGGLGNVFAELNRGEDVTKGLRKVDKSEMTHKNPELRTSSVVPASTSPVAGALRYVRLCSMVADCYVADWH